MSDQSLPLFLKRTQTLLQDSTFFLSSIPNVDRDVGAGLERQMRASRAVLTGIADYTLLSKEELEQYLASQSQDDRPRARTEENGQPGRPRCIIDLARAIELHDMGNTWEDVSKAMGVARRTLYNHLEEAGLSPQRIPYSDISDEDLDSCVAAISLHHPLAGGIIVQGHLRAQGLNVEINRVRQSLRRVDEDGVALRFQHTTYRRVYSVRGSNALWHQDGNEKLKPWGFYVHGCVDGFSRMIIYLVCSNNKRSRTVGECFMDAISKYGWPSRVRGDYGTENNVIERRMVDKWGVAHRPYLRGRSVHNVRIERLWRDVRKDSLEFFRQIFLHLEKVHLLDPDSELHLVCLYLVYQPRIQKSLEETTASWNNHALRTERYKTPVALYQLSREAAINAGYWHTDAGDPGEMVDELYGMEAEDAAQGSEEGVEEQEEKEAGVIVTDDEHIAEAREILGDMDFGKDDGVWGMDLYCEAVLRLHAHYHSSN